MEFTMLRIDRGWIAGGMLLALVAAPGQAEVKQVRLGVKGATCAT
jgi:hypothetical protein